ncbi:hypothetical protein [Phenylobacterium sp.]|uniref:hypothetical protein n=1 Tax=Phenylobacterium sp. TaxID=1871053 RepID=UPI00273375E3|nr:hypothetical protein [Phenylobacterium sp.]MDP3855256.1 hypothetical protein [Phenylobacterium sp.]
MQNPTTEADPAAIVASKTLQEGFELWKCGCDIWLDYLAGLPGVRTPGDLVDANARLLVHSLNIYGLATGGLLTDAGLKAPILNDG